MSESVPLGASTLIVVLAASAVAPFTARLFVPRIVRVVPRLSALLIVNAPVEARNVPVAMVSAPVPIGPLMKVSATPVTASRVTILVLAPTASPPAWTLTPPVKTLAPESWRSPLPVLVRPADPAVESPIGAEILKVGVAFATVVSPFTVTGETLKVRVAPLRSKAMPPVPVPEIRESDPGLAEIAVTSPVSFRIPVPVSTCGPAGPPSLSNERPARV